MNPYAAAVMGPSDPELEGLFSFIGKIFTKIARVMAPGPMFLLETGKGVAEGKRFDKALASAAKGQLESFTAVLPLAQIGLSFIPGIGQGINAALGAAMALAEGKPITEAFLAGLKNALPGGPLVKAAIDVGIKSAIDVASGKRLDTIALNAVRSRIPGGPAAQKAFDMGLALAQAKNIQQAGLGAAAKFLPNNPLARKTFEMTKQALAGKSRPPPPRPPAQVRSFMTKKPTPPKPIRKPIARPTFAPRVQRFTAPIMPHLPTPPAAPPPPPTIDVIADPPPPEESPSHALPIAIGAVALAAAAGGGAWWWKRHRRA